MATYPELYHLFTHAALADRVEVACLIASEAIRIEAADTPNHVNRLFWAKKVFQSPASVRLPMLGAVLARNAALSVSVLESATDTALQTVVNDAVNLFADGT